MISLGGADVMTLNQALRLWQVGASGRIDRQHPPRSRLFDFLVGRISPEMREETLAHLSCCDRCRTDLREVERFTRIDVGFKMAAETHPPHFSFLTEGGKFKILYRDIKGRKGVGLVSLSVEDPYRKEMEGRKLAVLDSKGKRFIEGEVKNGEIGPEKIDPKDIAWDTVRIREDEQRAVSPQ